MKKILMVLTLAIITATSFGIEDTPENRRNEAERYIKITPPEQMMKDMADKMARNFPPEQREEFKSMMTTYFDIGAMEKAMFDAMVKHFTAEELKALADFYGSKIGKSAIKKMGNYMADIMPAIQAEVMKAQAKSMKAAADKNREKEDIKE